MCQMKVRNVSLYRRASINSYTSTMSPKQYRRKRGVILTAEGFQKLESAKEDFQVCNNGRKTYTLETLSALTGLDVNTLSRVFTREKGVDKRTLSYCFKAFDLCLELKDYTYMPQSEENEDEGQQSQDKHGRRSNFSQEGVTGSENSICDKTGGNVPVESNSYPIDLNLAPDVSTFYGRSLELETLREWIQIDDCRVIVISGSFGIGKTYLAAKLLDQIHDDFDCVIWRSFSYSIDYSDFIKGIVRFIFDNLCSPSPGGLDDNTQLLHYLKEFRCLIMLDGFETDFRDYHSSNASFTGDQKLTLFQRYFDELIRLISGVNHQSCLIITGQKYSKRIREFEGRSTPTRIMRLQGLQVDEGQSLFITKGNFKGTPADWSRLITYYAGNPLLLKYVASLIQTLFDSDISSFLKQNVLITDDVFEFLNEHTKELSDMDKEILVLMSKQDKPVSFSELCVQSTLTLSGKLLLGAITTLYNYCLIEQKDGNFFLHPFLKDYVLECFTSST